MQEIILVHVTGGDKPGVTAGLTGVLAGYGVDILDIGQVVIHDHLTLGILIRIPPKSETAPILKDLLFKAHELGVTLKLNPLEEDKYGDWAASSGRQRYIVTLIGRAITSRELSRIAGAVAENGLNIDTIHRLSGRVPLKALKQGNGNGQRQACVEFSVRGTPNDPDALRSRFMEIASELHVDISFQEDTVFRRNRRLVAFDMDSTLISTEVIDELAARYGVGEQVSAITESAMRGELDFKESLRKRLALLKGLDESVLEDVAENLPLSEGAERLISNLKRVGYKIAIISGGFTYFGEMLKKKLGLDYVYANRLEIKDKKLTGKVIGSIVDGPKKAELLTKIAQKEDISLQQVIAVGDGANDLPMLGIAGLGIAFHAKPKVKRDAGHAISNLGLDSILYLTGVRDRETIR